MNHWLKKCYAIVLFFMLLALQADMAPEAAAKAAAYSFDSVWFYRDGTKVVPEIGRRWLTVAFDLRANPTAADVEPGTDIFIKKRANAILLSHAALAEYLYDPNIAEDACFFKMRNGLKPEDISRLISQLNTGNAVKYVHPTVILNGKTYAFFNAFQMEWKTGIRREQREKLLRETHAVFDEKENRYTVNVAALPFFKALNLLSEDVRVQKVTPSLVEIKPSISARLSFFMSGGNIGDNIPFKLTVVFSDRVTIDPSSLATLNLRPPNLQKELFDSTFDPYDYAKAATKSPIVITGRVRIYAPGEYTVPAVAINYSCPTCPASAVRAVETDPVLLKIASIIPKNPSENRLIVPTDPVKPDYGLAALQRQSQLYFRLAVTGGAGLLLCAAWLLILRLKVIAERRRLKERKNDRELAEQLRMRLRETPDTPHWRYLGEIGALLREYLVVRYGIDANYRGGSARQFMETVRSHIPQECVDSISAILTSIDNSVSLETEHYEKIDNLQRETSEIVDICVQNA